MNPKETTTVGDLCESIIYGVTASAVWNNHGIRFLRITDLTETGVDWSRVPSCEISDRECKSALLQDGDIVVARTGGTVGKSYLVSNPPSAVNASYLLRLRPNKSVVMPEYLHLFMQSEAYWRQLMDRAQGAAQPNVNGTTLSAISLKLPNLSDQQSVIKLYREIFDSTSRARQAAKMQLAELDFVPQKLLGQGKTKHRYSLGEVLVEVKDGVGAKWANFPVLGATRAGLAPAKEQPGKSAERYKPVSAGTVFYNPMRILIGSIAFVDEHDAPGITSPDYVVLRGKEGVVDSRWFYYWLRSPWGEQCIQSLARGAVRERMLFNRLAEGKIELPDFSCQVKASQALCQIRPIRAAIQKQLTELDLLPQKLLAKIFAK